jgi:hypothetical protein
LNRVNQCQGAQVVVPNSAAVDQCQTRCLKPFSKVEKWTKEGFKIERMHYAGNNLGEAR